MNYEALAAMSFAVWRLIGTVREPVLYPLRDVLVKYLKEYYGKMVFAGFVWLAAFALGYGYATMAGTGGDMLAGLGWTDGYETAGQLMSALAIACGSAGLRVAEKVYNGKMDNALPE
jgi:hypothetical protein